MESLPHPHPPVRTLQALSEFLTAYRVLKSRTRLELQTISFTIPSPSEEQAEGRRADSLFLEPLNMSKDLKQRRKGLSKQDEDSKAPLRLEAETTEQEKCIGAPCKRKDSSHVCPEPTTVLCLLSLFVCLVLTWFVFQQSVTFVDVEKRYRLLEIKASALNALEEKVSLISEKLETSESILPETASTITIMTHLEQEVSSLRETMHGIQNSEQVISKTMQRISEKFQNVTDLWNNSLDQMNKHIGSLKSEAHIIHNQVTTQINTAEQGIASLSERLRELDDSTVRNTRTLKRQEEDELLHVEQQLDVDAKLIEKLEVDQSVLVEKNTKLSQKLRDYEPKLEECRNHLPSIENAVRAVLKVSNELVGIEKKMEDLTMQTFNMEDHMLKAVSEILEIQQILEGMQYDNSILKLQNELVVLKERVHEYALSLSTKEVALAEHTLKASETADQY